MNGLTGNVAQDAQWKQKIYMNIDISLFLALISIFCRAPLHSYSVLTTNESFRTEPNWFGSNWCTVFPLYGQPIVLLWSIETHYIIFIYLIAVGVVFLALTKIRLLGSRKGFRCHLFTHYLSCSLWIFVPSFFFVNLVEITLLLLVANVIDSSFCFCDIYGEK